jgi:hypothetical protein
VATLPQASRRAHPGPCLSPWARADIAWREPPKQIAPPVKTPAKRSIGNQGFGELDCMAQAPVDELLRDGAARHARGDLDGAARLYRKVLAQRPGEANALNLLAVDCSAIVYPYLHRSDHF